MDKSPTKSQTSQENEPVLRPLEFIVPDSVANRFSNFTTVQCASDVFTLSFFEIQQPILLGTEGEIQKAAEALNSVPAVCLARIILTPSHFKKLINAMQQNYEKYEKSSGVESP